MSQCQRCGASNEPASRFCVACGAPLMSRPAAPAPASAPPKPAPIHTSRPPDPDAPPNSSLPFAETASPPTREDFEVERAKLQARGAMAPGAAPYQSSAPPAAAYAPPAPAGSAATAAMPGVAQDPEALPEGVARILAGFLVTYDGDPLGRSWPIYQGRNRIGRKGAGVELDIELDHPTASSRHAVLLASACPGRMKLEDTGSTNGTLVNGARLATGVRHELSDGDRVRFGLLTTLVKIV